MLGGQRNIPKSILGGRGTKRLSERTGFNSASTPTVVVFAPGLSRGNSPGDTERDSGNDHQHLVPVHGTLRVVNGAALLRHPWKVSNAHRGDKRVIHVTVQKFSEAGGFGDACPALIRQRGQLGCTCQSRLAIDRLPDVRFRVKRKSSARVEHYR